MNNADNQYLDLCQHILDNGVRKEDRTGTGTLSVFGYQMRFDLSKGFPLLTTKKTSFKLIKEELLWFLSGSTDVRELIDQRNHIWTPDATRWYNERFNRNVTEDEYIEMLYDKRNTESYRNVMANLGSIYGAQWRRFTGDFGEIIDQIENVIDQIKTNTDSRRHIVTAWNPAEIEDTALPPCHYAFQFYVANGKLSCMFQMRSSDVPLGLPFNIASYALLTHMIAQVTDLEVGELIYTGGDVHIYLNQIDGIQEQLKRREQAYELPQLWLNPNIKDIDDFTADDIKILNYKSHPAIKMPVSAG